MSATRIALLVGCCGYQDPESFPPLSAPAEDVEALERVLADPEIGDFDVATLLDEPSGPVSEQIEKFFAGRKPDDLLLLYFSCHGVLDPDGQLYFVSANTKKDVLDSTGISAQWVRRQMDRSRSQRIVVLLDCCYSGAFPNGRARGDADVRGILEQQFNGRGRIVVTASRKLELAHESVFTNAVVEGLRSGAADLDGDGQISVYELFQYVGHQVRQQKPEQTPTMSVDNMQGRFIVAKNRYPSLPLPIEVQQALGSEDVWQRSWAVGSLRRLLAGDHQGGLKRAARQALIDLGRDRNRRIRKAASEALGIAPDHRRTRNRWLVVTASLVLAVGLVASIIWPLGGPNNDNAVSGGAPPCLMSTRLADGVLSMGTLLPRTGAFIYSGPAQEAAVQLAVKDINDAGGIPGMAVKLDAANQRDEGNPSGDTASQSTDVLLTGEVDAIIGPSTSPAAAKVIDKVTCAGVIMFAPANTSPVFTTYPDHGLYFRTSPLSTFEGSVLGNLVVADGNSTVVMMSRDDLYGDYLRKATEKKVQESGGQVLDSFHYDPNALDYKKEIQRVKAQDPDAIVLIGFSESAQILAGMIEEGLGPRSKRVYVAGAYLTNTLVGQVSPRDPSALSGMRGTPLDAGGEEFVQRLRESSPGLQDLTYAPQAYDAVVITALAAAIAGTDQSAAIAKEINGVTRAGERCTSFVTCMALVKAGMNIDYDGPSGRLEFSDPGEPSVGTYVISEIQADGTVTVIRSETVGS